MRTSVVTNDEVGLDGTLPLECTSSDKPCAQFFWIWLVKINLIRFVLAQQGVIRLTITGVKCFAFFESLQIVDRFLVSIVGVNLMSESQ